MLLQMPRGRSPTPARGTGNGTQLREPQSGRGPRAELWGDPYEDEPMNDVNAEPAEKDQPAGGATWPLPPMKSRGKGCTPDWMQGKTC
eukprot:3170295-Amphidinium_carterae.1